jgi:PPOX class probable F420-dependent enzyme
MVRMTTISEGIRALLATGPLGHVVTLDADGSPHVSLAWVGVDGDELVWSTFSDQRKIANLRRDPRIAISFMAHASGGEFLHPYLVVNGHARLEDGGALEVMDRLAPAYIGPGATFPMRDVPPGVTVRVTVERVYGQGPWKRGVEAEAS